MSTRRSPENVVGRLEEQGRDLRRVLLAVAVDAAVALLDADERPRDVEVDELVALQWRLTPSEATSPVTSTRMGEASCLNSSTISCCSTSESPPWRMRTWLGGEAEVRAMLSRSQPRVAMRSAKTTTRSGRLARADADLVRGAVTRAAYLPVLVGVGGLERGLGEPVEALKGLDLAGLIAGCCGLSLERRLRPSRRGPPGRRGTPWRGSRRTARRRTSWCARGGLSPVG